MNTKNLTLNDLGIKDELIFIKGYHKYLLEYCIENNIPYDGKIALKIMELNEDIDRITANPDDIIKPEDMKLLIRIAEGRVFLETTKLSEIYNTKNTHDILRVPRYKMYHVLEHHGY
ncbi:hypothetical protein [Candidatus Methanosphaera massiliense]|jgi:hypothetical protein|uniref:hypothetical protein n=1 Tax=Methanosphaera TaxID=2316 RepID=UPI002380B8C1|nr:hypothetical protein [Candidatus Methanosphaera massiliense]MDD6285645.1 hypothetical protein [Methanobacteriaceae archaeon]MDE4079025.1 hypothetical protein [Candidatus Methanosphaera massiliense]MDY2744503.1 hypothetical protein [Methanosphaera sp.]